LRSDKATLINEYCIVVLKLKLYKYM